MIDLAESPKEVQILTTKIIYAKVNTNVATWNVRTLHQCGKEVSKYGVFFGPYFPIFRLNTEIYSVNLRIKSDYRRIRTKKNSVFGRFSRSAAQVIRQMNNY